MNREGTLSVIVPELTEYKDDNVQISKDQIKTENKTFPITDIDTVTISVLQERPEVYDRIWYRLVLLGSIIVVALYLLDSIFHFLPSDLHSSVSYIIIVVMSAILIFIYFQNSRADKTYHVVLRGKFGTVDALSSKYSEYAVIIAET